MTAYRYAANWAELGAREGDARGDHQPAMRLTIVGTAGLRKTRVIAATVHKCKEIFGARGPVVMAGERWPAFSGYLATHSRMN